MFLKILQTVTTRCSLVTTITLKTVSTIATSSGRASSEGEGQESLQRQFSHITCTAKVDVPPTGGPTWRTELFLTYLSDRPSYPTDSCRTPSAKLTVYTVDIVERFNHCLSQRWLSAVQDIPPSLA